MPIGGMLSGN